MLQQGLSHEECLLLGKAIGMRYVIARPLLSLARIAIDKGEHARAHQLLSESLSLCQELGDKGRQATALALSGRLALAQGDATTARSLAAESLLLFRESGDHQGAAESLSMLGMAEAAQGDFAAAQALYAEWLTLAGSDERGIAFSLEGVADAVVAQGQLAWAVPAVECSRNHARPDRSPYAACNACSVLPQGDGSTCPIR